MILASQRQLQAIKNPSTSSSLSHEQVAEQALREKAELEGESSISKNSLVSF